MSLLDFVKIYEVEDILNDKDKLDISKEITILERALECVPDISIFSSKDWTNRCDIYHEKYEYLAINEIRMREKFNELCYRQVVENKIRPKQCKIQYSDLRKIDSIVYGKSIFQKICDFLGTPYIRIFEDKYLLEMCIEEIDNIKNRHKVFTEIEGLNLADILVYEYLFQNEDEIRRKLFYIKYRLAEGGYK